MNFYGFPDKLRGILWNFKDTPWNSMEIRAVLVQGQLNFEVSRLYR